MRYGILTSGGDCPGLNAVLRAVARRAEAFYSDEVVAFHDGWSGVLNGAFERLDIARCRGILPRGGTILGTSRVTPYQVEGGLELAKAALARHDLEGVIVVGGNGSLAAAHELTADGVPCLGVPKTIDNDIAATEMTFGFDTAVEIATEAIDRLHTTAEAHHRVLVVEVMGRDVGHIALRAGLAGGATMTLIPEVPFDLDEVCAALVRRHQSGRWASIVVVAEGATPVEGGSWPGLEYTTDRYGHRLLGGIGAALSREIEERTGFESRVTVLGHVQRGGTPSAYDRVLSTRYGIAAADLAHQRGWDRMVALRADEIVTVSLAEAISSIKSVSPSLIEVARQFFA
jgi:phosphofructokinase-like protein